MKKIISKLKKNSNTEKETEIENVDKDEIINLDGKDLIIKKEHPFNEICKSCGGQIKNIKYICVICPDCILCQKCESIHIHPVLKCKSIQLSSLKSIYIYMNKRNQVIQSFLKNEKDSSVFGLFQDIFSAKYEINLSSPINKITMRPNKSIKIPITIQNLSSTKIECKLLQLYLKREQNDIYMTVESNNHIGEYNFNVELYSIKNIKLKSNILNFNVIVNDDEEEEELNEAFKEYLNIVVASKETKMGIKKIMKNEDIKEDPITIFQFLKNNNNNVEKTIENLISKNSDNINKNIL